MTALLQALVLGLFLVHWQDNGVSAFQHPLKPTTTSCVTSTSLFYQNNATFSAAAAPTAAVRLPPTARMELDNVNIKKEVDRRNLHPIFKMFPADVPLSAIAATAILFSPILVPMLPLAIAWRKHRWEKLVEASTKEHQAAFEATTKAYRQSQRVLVDQLLQVEASNERQLPSVIAVTMATGQEGQGVVRALAQEPGVQKLLALVRNPSSSAAQALKRLSPAIELVQCDSTNVASLEAALQPAQAVFLATTLNRASAGHWDMDWEGAAYQIRQGEAFAQAHLPNLKQVVYGTAPLKKWPDGFAVEPPIHYAAKWRVEELLKQAHLPVTFWRKCPYHENFTKLTKAKAKVRMGVEAGGAFEGQPRNSPQLESGQYQIKALTSPEASFTYNMMDPRDTGKWAVLAFSHPSLLIGQSLSVASDALTGPEMAQAATECMGQGVHFEYAQQPRWLFETLAFVEPTFVYIGGLQRWAKDGGVYDLDVEGVQHVRKLVPECSTWADHLEREGLGQFTETMADLLPDFAKRF